MDRAGTAGPTIRLDGAAGSAPIPGDAGGGGGEGVGRADGWARRWARLERAWWLGLVVTMGIFSAIPIVNMAPGAGHQGLRVVVPGGPGGAAGPGRLPAARDGPALPVHVSALGGGDARAAEPAGPDRDADRPGGGDSASWIACIGLSAWLAAGPGGRRHPLVVIVPTLSVIVLIHNIYLLGQPNLLLLALLLGAFACLRLGRQVAAGALVATAAAIKAFPILVLGYLVYRRMWKASFATVAALAAWLLIAPLPFRTPAQAVDDLSVWARGMLFTYDKHGIAQRPLRSYSYKNQSIMAVMHRLLRDVPADGESILSGRRTPRRAPCGRRRACRRWIRPPTCSRS